MTFFEKRRKRFFATQNSDKILFELKAQGEFYERNLFKNGKEIHSKSIVGEEEWEEWKEYDINGNLIHYKSNDGEEEWNEYDSDGNCIHYKDCDGFEIWREYNSNGKCIHHKDIDGDEKWNEYDSKGKLIHSKYNDGKEFWYKYIFWDNGKMKMKIEYAKFC